MTKKSKADEWRPDASKLKPGATLRIELEYVGFSLSTGHLTCEKVGLLQRMLIAEALGEPIPDGMPEAVLKAFARRDEYRRIRGSFGRTSLPLAVRQEVFERDGRRCGYCDVKLTWESYHCDHVISVKRGGTDDLDNLRAACAPCNLAKSAKDLADWLR